MRQTASRLIQRRKRRNLLGMLTGSVAALAAAAATGASVWAANADPAPGGAISPMQAGQPSRTAMAAAVLRAAHQLYDSPLVFEDALAVGMAGSRAVAALQAGTLNLRNPTSMRAHVVMRARYTEDMLAAAFERGVRQYVVLGAGLDTFGCRSPLGAALRVFEVDHPATQRWKRAHLIESGITTPASLSFAPVDFERETIADGLARAGFDARQPAFVSMLGVSMYLTRAAAQDTFRFAAALPAGSELVFDYGVPDTHLPVAEQASRLASAARVAAQGEPWINWYEPEALATELRSAGFGHTGNLDPITANARYFAGRTDALRLANGGQVMLARV